MTKDKEKELLNEETEESQDTIVDEGEELNEEEQNDNKLIAIFSKFHDELEENEIPEAQNNCDVNQHNLESAQKTTANRKKNLDKSFSALSEYLHIKYEISLNLGQGIIELKNDIADSKAKFQEMDTLFGEALTNIKQVSKDVLGIKNALDNLSSVMKEECNKKELKELNKAHLNKILVLLQKIFSKVYHKSDHYNTVKVKASGVKALLNIDSIVHMSDEIKVLIDKFNADILANIAKYAAQLDSNKTAYDTSIVELCTAESNNSMANMLKQGLDSVFQFSDPETNRSAKDIDKIVEEAEQNFTVQEEPATMES